MKLLEAIKVIMEGKEIKGKNKILRDSERGWYELLLWVWYWWPFVLYRGRKMLEMVIP